MTKRDMPTNHERGTAISVAFYSIKEYKTLREKELQQDDRLNAATASSASSSTTRSPSMLTSFRGQTAAAPAPFANFNMLGLQQSLEKDIANGKFDALFDSLGKDNKTGNTTKFGNR